MKKLITLLAISATMCGMAAYGQETVSIQTTGYGQLGELLGDRITTVQALTVTGPIDKSDFDVMRKAIREGVLSEIDLEEAQCLNNEIPDEALRMPYIPLWNESPRESPRKSYDWDSMGVVRKELNKFRKIILPACIERIGEYAFAGANIESLDMPPGVSELGEGCFLGTNIRKLVIGSQIRKVPRYAFQACPYLREVTLQAPVETLERGAFGLNGLDRFEFPATFVSDGYAFEFSGIGEAIFNSAESLHIDIKFDALTKVVFNEGVETILCNLTSGCRNLSMVVLPSTLGTIQERAFADTPSLQDVYCKSAVPPAASPDAFSASDGSMPPQASLFVPIGAADAYRNSVGWNLFPRIVEIEDSQFPSGVDAVATDSGSIRMYDMQGRQVNPETADPGIYIRNGRKILIR